MKNIRILDCTLRDGGYCNKWTFGRDNIKRIIRGLNSSGVEIIECGFISDRVQSDPDVSKFPDVHSLSSALPERRDGVLYVAMINYGEYDPSALPERTSETIDGIRVAYHRKDRYHALEMCAEIKKKGYKVFLQPMVSLCYTDDEYVEMIRLANGIRPYAFYIVDSFGMMKAKDLSRLFRTVKDNLDPGIAIGFHSHNNMQLAYSNAQSLCAAASGRDLIVDASVFGMGRGAGNLNTELFVEYLNDNYSGKYSLNPLLEIIDTVLVPFYEKQYWGYSLPNYLSAAHNAHPNYAGFLSEKNTLTVRDMNSIFGMMDPEKKAEFDKNYIEGLYLKYMEAGDANGKNALVLKERFASRTVLLIAPGKSSVTEKDKITKTLRDKDIVSVSVNFDYGESLSDYIFLSNLRRFRELDLAQRGKCIVTSNIPLEDACLKVDYGSLLNDTEYVKDNAGLLAIKFLMDNGCRKVLLAGFDGYSHESKENYGDSEMSLFAKNAVFDAINSGINKVLSEYSKKIDIEFLTKEKYLRLN